MSSGMDSDRGGARRQQAAGDALISISGLTKQYGGAGQPALDGVRLQVAGARPSR